MQQPSENYGQGPLIGGPDQRDPLHPHQRQRAPELSAEEKRIFKECNDAAYFQRSLPASFFLGGLAFIGVKRGILTGHPRFGATPKVLIASVVGYFIGKVSYMDTCRGKFLTQAPNSNIAIAIRKARGEEVFFEEQPAVVGSTEPETFDQDQDSQQGLIMGGESADQKKRFSYDDLREQHRRFQKIPPPPPPSVQQPATLMSPARQAPPSLMPPEESWSEATAPSRGGRPRTNKYGDEGFE